MSLLDNLCKVETNEDSVDRNIRIPYSIWSRCTSILLFFYLNAIAKKSQDLGRYGPLMFQSGFSMQLLLIFSI